MTSETRMVLFVLLGSPLLAQYYETTYSFKGVLQLNRKEIEIVRLKISNDAGTGEAYTRDLRSFDKAWDNLLPMSSVSKIDFVSMSADEENKACNGGTPGPINPCLFRKANVTLRDGRQMNGIYLRVHGFTAYGRDGMPIEFNNREYKVFSLAGEAFDRVSH